MAVITLNVGEINTLLPISLGNSAVDDLTACQASQSTYYIPAGETFATTTVIWQNNDGTGVPVAGYYSDGTIARQWNGTDTLSASTYCTNALTTLGYHLTTPSEACEANSTQQVYIPLGFTFENTPVLYLNPDETGFPPAGFYSDGTIYRNWNGATVLGAPSDCVVGSVVNLSSALGNTSGAATTACSNPQNGVYFVPQGESFSTATGLYTNSNLTTPAPAAMYSDGIEYKYWDGSAFGGLSGICGI